MNKNIRKAVEAFKRKFGLSTVSYKSLCAVLEKQGYTVIPFNKTVNEGDVARVIDNLNLSEYILSCNGFTFTNERYRLVFVNADLSEDEKLMVLAHEEGHIYFEHSSARPVIGNDVLQEHEANEFAHYLLHPSVLSRLFAHKRALIIAVSCILLLAVGLAIFTAETKKQAYYGDFYVTSAGTKYHKKECIFVKNKSNVHRLTRQEFDDGSYEPCNVCLPQ